MIEAAVKMEEETRPRAKIELRIDYTRQVTRFGYIEVRMSSGTVLWRSSITGAVTRCRPRYVIEPK